MNNLINIKNEDGKLLVSSREVAENFDKEIRTITRDIKNITNTSEQKCSHLFIEGTYKDSYGRDQPEYLLTRDGFTLLAMGFTGKKALEWKLKYIEAFNKMEEELTKPRALTPTEELRLHYKALEEHSEEITEVKNEVAELRESMPLFNIDCKELQALVRKVATKALGGYKCPAYDDRSVRAKVYSDIQRQLRREFGVDKYERIKRSQLDKAKEIVSSYRVPLVLEEEIQIINRQVAI